MTRCLKRIVLVVSVLFVVAGISTAGNSPYTCKGFLYKDRKSREPIEDFSQTDTIYFSLKFDKLPKGNYSVLVEWINPLKQTQETNKRAVAQTETSDVRLRFWLKFHKAGFFRKLISPVDATGYDVKFYGMWQAVAYLNGEEITRKFFSVQ